MKGRKPALIIDNTGSAPSVKTPPAWFSKEAKSEWRRVMPLLTERRILTDADMASLENYCISVGRVRQLEALLSEGFDAPTFRAQDKAMGTARLLAAELGLTPVSRSRPAMKEDVGDDDGDNPLNVS